MTEERAPAKVLFLVSASGAPCGVEAFARTIARTWERIGGEARSLAVSGRWGDFPAIWAALAETDALVVNVPVVAWKKMLLTPLAALCFARLRGCASALVLHEWADLDWRRRLVVGVYALSAQRLVFSSPHVRSGFLASRAMRFLDKPSVIAPIPSNVPPVAPAAAPRFGARLLNAKAQGALIVGHFGSIYPKKQCGFVLDVAQAAARAGRPVFCLFVGGFVKGADRVEEDFFAKARRSGVEDDLLVTGYVDDFAELNALLREADCFVYRFPEGLTSRRGSVLACLQSGRPVIVNAPREPGELDHHRAYRRALADGSLRLVDSDADLACYVDALGLLGKGSVTPLPAQSYDECWRDAATAVAVALEPRVRRRFSARFSRASIRA
jgi:glycosyltransferase involved in cell wall biosynthesis